MHLHSSLTTSIALFAAGLVFGADVPSSAAAVGTRELRDGRLYVNGRWTFLKIGKPLLDFANPTACKRLREALPILKAKGYNALELNCYWHHFDKDGDGVIDADTHPLAELIEAIDDAGMFPCLSVETYGVGGGTLTEDFWNRFPEAVAVDHEGKQVRDTEYGFNSIVPSILHPGYREAVHAYIRNLVSVLPHKLILHYETTVEPQFMGDRDIDFSVSARAAYIAWSKKFSDAPAWPETFPIPDSFRLHPVWLRFRAESLADWVNQDIAAFRSVVGPDALIAVDYLETGGRDMAKRNGDSVRFLTALEGVNIIQVNWHWHLGKRAPNQIAYDTVHKVMKATGRSWAVSEHMTLNGSDYRPAEVVPMLRNALAQGTGYGFEFVNLAPVSKDKFAMYNDDWSPKPLMAEVDDHWAEWLREISAKHPNTNVKIEKPAQRAEANHPDRGANN
jgi:hypothetical protein